MKLSTEPDYLGEIQERDGFNTFYYADESITRLPYGFITVPPDPAIGDLYIGKFSAFGPGSSVRFELPNQKVTIGRYVNAGANTKFMLAGFHETRTISTCEFATYDNTMKHVNQRFYEETVIGNDVWFGDDCLIMAGANINHGCVVGTRTVLPSSFRSDPFGVYIGSPVRKVKYRFSQEICKLLLELKWWDKPVSWVREHNEMFLMNLHEAGAADMLRSLINAG